MLLILVVWSGDREAFGQQNQLTPMYVGPQTVHLHYSYTDYCNYHHCAYQLKGTSITSTAEVVLREETVSLGTTHQFTGTFHYNNLVPKTYRFSLVKLAYNDKSELQDQIVLLSSTAAVDGESAIGLLLFDEVWNGTVRCGSVSVPSDRSLQVQEATLYDAGENAPCVVRVSGMIELDSDSDISRAEFVLYRTHHLTDLRQTTITFATGSEGSSIKDATNITLYIQVPMHIEDSDHVEISVDKAVDGDISIKNISQLRFNYIKLRNNDLLQIEQSTLTGGISADGGSVIIQSSQFSGMTSIISWNNRLIVRNSVFIDGVDVSGKDIQIIENEFNDRVTLHGNQQIQIQDNVFLGPLVFNDACYFTEYDVQVQGNSFLGREALKVGDIQYWYCRNPIAIGSNYYGDAAGPVMAWRDQPNQQFLEQRGATVEVGLYSQFFTLDHPLPTGRYRQNTLTFPSIWMSGYRLGQSLLVDDYRRLPLIRGKETLLTIDLAVSERSLRGVQVYAEFDGQVVYPTNRAITLHRDLADYGRYDTEHGLSTVNFILPPVSQPTATLKVFLDTRGVTGYSETGRLQQIQGIPETLTFSPPPAQRPVTFRVVPVELPEGRANIAETVRAVHTLLPAMFPILPSQVRVEVAPVLKISSYWTRIGLMNGIATKLAADNTYRRYRQQQGVDFIIAVMPHRSLGEEVHGANLPLRRSVLFVDERYPAAFIHEMGHALGLYTLREQYEWPHYPPVGMQLQDATFFLGVPDTVAQIKGQFADCDQGRICHAPGRFASWRAIGEWYDVMGLVLASLREWPSEATITTFEQFFRSLSAAPAPSESAPAATSAVPTTSTGRFVAFQAHYELIETEGYTRGYTWEPCLQWRIIPDTIRLVALPTGTAGMQDFLFTEMSVASYLSQTESLLPLCSSTYQPVYLTSYDASGRLLSSGMVGRSLSPPDPRRRHDTLFEIIPIDPEAVRIEIARTLSGTPLATFIAGNLSAPRIVSPSPGANLAPTGAATSTISLQWEYRASVTGQPTLSTNPSLTYVVEYSPDDGANWYPLDAFVEETSLSIPVTALPVSDHVRLRVIASDGFNTSSAEVSGLVRPDLRPLVNILSPPAGVEVSAGTPLLLQATAHDPETQAFLEGTWRTVTGTLGVGSTLANIVLPAGQHTLSYEVVDQHGHRVSNSVQVTVVESPTIDVRLEADALSVVAPQPLPGAAPLTLTQGVTNTLRLQIAHVVQPGSAELALYVQPPGGQETLVISREAALQPAQRYVLDVPYNPPMNGSYTFRAVINSVNPPDAHTDNNQRTWTAVTIQPPTIGISLAESTTMTASVGFSFTLPVTITNTGDRPLLVTNIAFGGADAARFAISQDRCWGTAIATGASCTIDVRFRPLTTGPVSTVLQITSTDPLHPLSERTINGTGIEPRRIYLPLIQRRLEW